MPGHTHDGAGAGVVDIEPAIILSERAGERMIRPISIGVTITGAVIVVGFLVISLILPMILILRNNH